MKKHTTRLALATLLGSAALLSACLVPERFSAKVDVQADTSYTFKYSGTAVHALALAQIKKAGTLSEKEQVGLKAEADKMTAKDPDIRRAVYKGDGRYELEIESHKRPGEALRALDIFTVSTDKDGVMTLSTKEINEKGKRELDQLGITVDGSFEVTLPKNAEVISHNATSTPSLFGMFGTYGWKIGKVDQRPMMRVKFKS